jgi:hypothetical protein
LNGVGAGFGLPDGYEPPDDWVLIRAAKYLGVAPWDLEYAPVEWLHRAVAYAAAEEGARADAQRDLGARAH